MEPPANPLPHNQVEPDTPTNVANAIHLLDSEIKDLQTEGQLSGWNQWVILAAIGGVFWLLTGELQNPAVDWPNIIKLTLAALLATDVLWWVQILLTAEPKATSEVRFRWSHFHFESNRALPILVLIRSAAILLVAFLSHLFNWNFLAPLAISYTITCFLMIVVLIGSFGPMFAVPNVKNMWSHFFVAADLIPMVLSLLVLLALIPRPAANNMSEYRIAGLIAAISFLVGLLMRVDKMSVAVPLLKESPLETSCRKN